MTTTHNLLDKKSKIMIIDSSGAMRPVLTSILGNLGYRNIIGESSLKDGVVSLTKYRFSWVICYLNIEEKLTGLHLLRLCLQYEELTKTRVSIFFTTDQAEFIPLAYSYGLLSAHKAPPTQNSLKNEIKEVISGLRTFEGNDSLVTYHYFRSRLLEDKRFADVHSLDQTLADSKKRNAKVYFNLAESQYLTQALGECGSTLYRIKLSYPNLGKQCDDLAQKYLGRTLSQNDQIGKPNKVLIIDHDQAAVKPVVENLQKIGCQQIQVMENGLDALEYLKQNINEVDLVLSEWKIYKISSPGFIQRVRNEISQTVPLIIHSSLVKRSDINLLFEMGVTTIIHKPLIEADFLTTILSELVQSKNPSTAKPLAISALQYLKAGEIHKAEDRIARLRGMPDCPEKILLPVEAELFYHQRKLDQAKKKSMESIKKYGKSVHNLSTLGKSCMALGEFQSALNCFNLAKTLSPHNLERLCLMASIHAQSGNHSECDSLLGSAEYIDGDARIVKESKANHKALRGDSEGAQKILEELGAIDTMVSFWNNQAIAYARIDELEKAFETYEKALNSLPAKEVNFRCFLSYNLGLAYVRAHKYRLAVKHLRNAQKDPDHRVFFKALDLYERVEEAIENNQKVVIRQSQEVSNTAGLEIEVDLQSFSACVEAGEYALYGVYRFSGTLPEEGRKLLTDIPTLKFQFEDFKVA